MLYLQYKKYIMTKILPNTFFNLIKCPIITDKTTRLLETNQYSFSVNRNINKQHIKKAIEHIFHVKVKSVNTLHPPIKKRRVKNITGKRPHYKRAIVTLTQGDTINLFP